MIEPELREWLSQFEKHIVQQITDLKNTVTEAVSDNKSNREQLIKIDTKLDIFSKDLNSTSEQNKEQHKEFYSRITTLETANNPKEIDELKKRLEENDDQTEINKEEISKAKAVAYTVGTVGGITVTILTILQILKII